MSWFMAVFLGIVQGVTEFLPISSSGHLALFQSFGLEADSLLHERHIFFDVLLHMGTLAAVCIAYRQDIRDMCKSVFALVVPSRRSSVEDDPSAPTKVRLAFLLVLATLPLVLVIPFRHAIEALGNRMWFVGLMLLITGGFLFYSDKLAQGRRTERNMPVLAALFVGFSQAIGVVPGISRSGITITAGMMSGLDRGFAVRFSFLMSIPAILGANIVTLFGSLDTVDWSLMPLYIVGVIVAGVVGYFAIHLVKLLVKKGSFGKFAYYCWGIGIIAIITSIVQGIMG
ncbi:MAG: undecaprenyl-diphosphate phosphatase [Oscillospiraceae bacterium]|nr:undecaprenyl-diphosphate phosphatase [Oscillospiraceae bacterium]